MKSEQEIKVKEDAATVATGASTLLCVGPALFAFLDAYTATLILLASASVAGVVSLLLRVSAHRDRQQSGWR